MSIDHVQSLREGEAGGTMTPGPWTLGGPWASGGAIMGTSREPIEMTPKNEDEQDGRPFFF